MKIYATFDNSKSKNHLLKIGKEYELEILDVPFRQYQKVVELNGTGFKEYYSSIKSFLNDWVNIKIISK